MRLSDLNKYNNRLSQHTKNSFFQSSDQCPYFYNSGFDGRYALGCARYVSFHSFCSHIKIICDKIPDLKPWGKLLGDTVPTRHKGEIRHVRRKKKPSLSEKIVS